MQASSFDFDVITGPSVPRDGHEPSPGKDRSQAEPAGQNLSSGGSAGRQGDLRPRPEAGTRP
jgi:hypothetical protein